MTAPMTDEVAKKIDDLFKKYRLRKYPKGQVLILSGESSEFVFQLIKGRVKQYDVNYRGDEVILNVFKPPAFFPMSQVINQTDNPYIFQTETAVELRQAPGDAVLEFIRANPDVLFDLLSRVYRGIDGVLGRLSMLMGSSAKRRIMYEILLACRRYGEKQPDGSCTFKLSEKDLAARAGLSRETASREIAKLARDNVLQHKDHEIKILDVDEFEIKLAETL